MTRGVFLTWLVLTFNDKRGRRNMLSEINNNLRFRKEWTTAGTALFLLFLLYIFLYFSPISSAVHLWIHAGAYNHCFLIVPIAAYLIWSDKALVQHLRPRPTLWGAAVSLAFAGLWWLSDVSGIAEGTHFAIVGILEGLLLGILGWPIFRALVLPFLYLFLMVPTGEALLPALQNFAAHAAAFCIEAAGIPTFRDGLVIEIPSGTYMIAPGCAGLNFVLASVALALAYAELIYRDWSRRLAFIAGMLLLAILGNALRIFMIIAFAHWTNNLGNIVDDHLLYGWGFFSALTLAAMAYGNRFAQSPRPPLPAVATAASGRSLPRAAALCVAAVAAFPLGAGALNHQATGPVAAQPALSCGGYSQLQADREWIHHAERVDDLAAADCSDGSHHLRLAVARLNRPLRDGKLLGLERRLLEDEHWTPIDRRLTQAVVDGQPVPVLAETYSRGPTRRQVWTLFRVGDAWRAAGWDTATADLAGQLAGHRRAAMVLLMADGDIDSEAMLRSFLAQLPLSRLFDGSHS